VIAAQMPTGEKTVAERIAEMAGRDGADDAGSETWHSR